MLVDLVQKCDHFNGTLKLAISSVKTNNGEVCICTHVYKSKQTSNSLAWVIELTMRGHLRAAGVGH